MIRNRITRIIAGIISCILVGVFACRVSSILIDNHKKFEKSYMSEYDISDEINKIYYKLWAVGNMWLRNLDEKGEFKGTEFLEKQTVSALQELGCMNSRGDIVLKDVSDKYEYLVSYGRNSFSNTDKSYDDFDSHYGMLRKNDGISYSNVSGYVYSINDFNLYDTNYGMHYYYLSGRGVALYDFDTSGLKSYVDDLGATLYYKTDGSTPLPDEYYNYDEENYNYEETENLRVYDEYGNVIENKNVLYEVIFYDKAGNVVSSERTGFDEYGNIIEHASITENPENEIVSRETIVYDEDDEIISREKTPEYEDGVYIRHNGEFINVEQDKFRTIQLKEMPLTIAIQPDAETTGIIQGYDKDREESGKKAFLSVMDNVPLPIIAFILLLFVLITGGYSIKDKKFVMSPLDRIFAEIPVAMALLAVSAGIIMAGEFIIYDLYNFICELYSEQTFYAICGFIYFVLFGTVILALNSLIVRIKCHSFWKTTFVYALITTIWKWIKKFRTIVAESFINRDMLRDDKFTRRFIVRTVVFSIAELFFAFCFIDWNAYGVLLFFSLILLAGYIALSLLDLNAMNRISKHITAINQGNYIPHKENIYSSAYGITQKLNNISAGIQSAVDRQVQSERMKIDLVTNVSHDLKTPLTSIISYIDLLSSEKLSPEARDYVNIIENKSQRLKTMVADLFDLAKATSHTDVDMEKIDAVILTNQVLADLSDKIELTGKQFKVDIQAENAPVMAEGKKMYRVLQNIIDNALKYSLDGTRIYFNLRNENGYCIINVKNIASYEMNFTPDEIMERFTRGDQSRSTEGNGLGLSIAKSFTEACGGKFSIAIDGDVFVAEVRMPINIQ